MKVIRDAVHGDIELFKEEMQLVHTLGFQRLHGCRQLGLTHLTYPCAKHSRFEHVLGVMHISAKIAGRLKAKGYFFQDENSELVRILRLSALLHDMGHVPFGHTLEDEMPLIAKHDAPGSRMEFAVTEVLNQSGNSKYVESVLQVLRAISESKDDEKVYTLVEKGLLRPEFLVLADIIGNTICADLLDYIKRDHMMTGIRATYDDRIFRYFTVQKHRWEGRLYDRVVIQLVKNGRVRNDCLADLLDILKLRYNLSDKVLFHPHKCAADAMLIRAISRTAISEDQLMKYSDDGLLDAFDDEPLIAMLRRREAFKPVFWCGRSDLNSYYPEASTEELVEGLHKDMALREQVEARVESELGLAQDSVLIFCPSPKMSLKPVRTLVQWKDGTIRRLNDIVERDDVLVARQISMLQEIYPQLWKLYLFVRPELRRQGARIQQAFKNALSELAHLNAVCNPALQHYLENGCQDYVFGEMLEKELESHPAYIKFALTDRIEVRKDAFTRMPVDPQNDDAFSEPDSILAYRNKADSSALKAQAYKIADEAVRRHKPRAQSANQRDLGI